MPIMSPLAGRRQSHLPRAAALALAALASTALTQTSQAAEFASAIDLGSLDGTTGFRLDGIDADDFSGISVASAGDVNGDGFADIVIGAQWRRSERGFLCRGELCGVRQGLGLCLGHRSRQPQRHHRLPARRHRCLRPQRPFRRFGGGCERRRLRRHRHRRLSRRSERGFLCRGELCGVRQGRRALPRPSISAAWTESTASGSTASMPAISSGFSVASAGDVNGDGFADIIIGAFRGDPSEDAAGESYVVFGRAPDGPVTRVGSAAGQYISGGAFVDSLSGFGGNDRA